MNDKKNINRLSLFASRICNGVFGIFRTKKDMNRMDIPKNPSDFFLLRYSVKPLLLSRVSMIILIIYVFFFNKYTSEGHFRIGKQE